MAARPLWLLPWRGCRLQGRWGGGTEWHDHLAMSGSPPLEASALREQCTIVESSLFSSDLVHTSWDLHIHPKGVSVKKNRG